MKASITNLDGERGGTLTFYPAKFVGTISPVEIAIHIMDGDSDEDEFCIFKRESYPLFSPDGTESGSENIWVSDILDGAVLYTDDYQLWDMGKL